jgi:hypothetical protein
VVSVDVVLHARGDYGDAPRAQDRLDAEALALDLRRDPWADRLRDLKPDRVREIVDRTEDDGIVRVVRHARGGDLADLRRMFRDFGVEVAFAEEEGWRELTLVPGREGRPTMSERQRVSARLGPWCEEIAAYLGATVRLYGYLDRNPERAKVCFARVVGAKDDASKLTSEEDDLTSAASAALNRLSSVLWPGAHEAYTLDELSRIVYDPFPAPTNLSVYGTILEREGFPGELSAPLRIPSRSLWAALERLEGRWVSPDPALAAWRADLSGTEVDTTALAALPRRVTAVPSAADVKAAVEAELRQPPIYRVRWAPGPAGEEDDPTLDQPPSKAAAPEGPGSRREGAEAEDPPRTRRVPGTAPTEERSTPPERGPAAPGPR